jgi:hypothetical protein
VLDATAAVHRGAWRGGGVAARGAGVAAGDASDRVPQRPVREHALVSSPAEFRKFVADFTEKWGKIIRAANIKVQ